ncbi:MAG: hypothetical protein H0T45_14875 [Pyrinomonadaceae bacterium]|nr:hypothetical protein [Pyrinomonadaceae bacterium]
MSFARRHELFGQRIFRAKACHASAKDGWRDFDRELGALVESQFSDGTLMRAVGKYIFQFDAEKQSWSCTAYAADDEP